MFTDVDNPNIYSWFRSGIGAPFIKIIIKREVHKMDKKLRELTKEARAAQAAANVSGKDIAQKTEVITTVEYK